MSSQVQDVEQGLIALGLTGLGKIHRNLPVPRLVEHSLCREEGQLAANGALVVKTGSRTGRSPGDRFIVKDATTEGTVWWGSVNRPMERAAFDRAFARAAAFIKGRDVYVFDGFSGADAGHRLPVRVVTLKAWHALFAHTLFLRPTAADLSDHRPAFTVVNCSELKDDRAEADEAGVLVAVDFTRKIVLIKGTAYAGEMKKAIFAIMNYILPPQGLMTMHCSANVGAGGDAALFFGLSGTGKTTLSADPSRRLIGDDEHGWGPEGVFNFEGGCYAKCIHLSATAEPQIYGAIRFGSVLENVVMDEGTRQLDYDSDVLTENTRVTYPVEYIPDCILEGRGGHPKNIFFLAADAFGVLPPLARLGPSHAMYHFLSGYTARVAGTEAGVTEPTATFSACFGAPFMPLHPTRYASLLAEKIKASGARCWLINTGWSGGPYGIGKRMPIKVTRALLTAALENKLDDVAFVADPVFGFEVPRSCPGVPGELLSARTTWSDAAAYDAKARHLATLFRKNFETYESEASPEVRAAAPSL